MSDAPTPPGWAAEQSLLTALAELGEEAVELRREFLPEINDPHWRDRAEALIDIATRIVTLHGTDPGAAFPHALTDLRQATRAFRVPRTDRTLEAPTPSSRALRAFEGRMRTAVDDVADALTATGVTVRDIPESPIRKRDREIASLLARLDTVDRRVAELEEGAATSNATIVQTGLVNLYVADIKVEVDLARLTLNIGDTTLDFAAFSRAAMAVGDLAADLVDTARAWKELTSARVRTLAEAVGIAAHRLTFRTRALARLVFGRVGDKELPAPSILTDRDGPDYPEMVLIPAGSFMMGIPDDETERVGGDPNLDAHARPVHLVTIDRPFWLARAPVTRGQFAIFARNTGYKGKEWRKAPFPQDDNHPVVNVSARDAEAYVAWLSKMAGHDYRLPSEAEWEYAARGHTTTARPWGDTWDPAMANAEGNHKGTTPVGSFSENPFGLHDMLGNVWEWCADDWRDSYKDASTYGIPWRASVTAHRVVRGGAGFGGARNARSAFRFKFGPSARFDYVGFRCARTHA